MKTLNKLTDYETQYFFYIYKVKRNYVKYVMIMVKKIRGS